MGRHSLMNEHGYCPNCGTDLDGGSIWEHFYNEFQIKGDWHDLNGNYSKDRVILEPEKAAIRADEVAKKYGATKTKGNWGRAIGIEYDRDCIEEWQCPDCDYRWPRK